MGDSGKIIWAKHNAQPAIVGKPDEVVKDGEALLMFVKVTLAVMETHPDNDAILENFCFVLTNLASNAGNRVAIAAARSLRPRS